MLNNQEAPILIQDLGMLFPKEDSQLKRRFGIFRCQCGTEFKTTHQKVKSGHTKSCGCHKIKEFIKRTTKHGMSSTRLYQTWSDMIKRCEYKKGQYYNIYGGRGISVCKEWRNDFITFYEWAIQNGYDESKEIDRIDNDGNYEPINCRFVCEFIQARNTRKIISTNTTGYRGVTFRRNRYEAKICVNYKTIFIGTFINNIDAAKAYDKYVIDNNLEHTINGVLL